jgi:LacI family transcriptional regulator
MANAVAQPQNGKQGSGRATLAVIAASAGVSVATVSKVVNGRADVSPTTRALVQELLAEHDYIARRPEPARSVPATAQPTVELLFHTDMNAYGIEVVQGVLDAGAASGIAVVIARRPADAGAPGRAAQWAASLVEADRRAVISTMDHNLTAEDVEALAAARIPLVVVDPLHLPVVEITSVGSTNFAGGVAATRHLLSLGHRRIGYIGGPVTAACNQARQQGYRAAMEAAGADVPDGYLRTGDFMYENGLREGLELLKLAEPPTAVFAGSDEMALGVIEAARSLAVRVPEDLSVIGFDDTNVAQLSSPPLTTIRQPLRDMGAVALRTAMRLAAGEKLDSHHVELATQLVVRRSTARLDPA